MSRTVSQTINLQSPNMMDKYITEIDNNGISIHPENDRNNEIEISDNIIIKRNGAQVASYGENAIIGAEESFHIKLDADQTEGRLSFYQGPNEVAYINNNELYITQSVVLMQMDLGIPVARDGFGQWSWKIRKNANGRNNLNLKWIG